MTAQLEHCPRELQGFFGSDHGRGQCRLEPAKAGERTLLNYWLEYRDFQPEMPTCPPHIRSQPHFSTPRVFKRLCPSQSAADMTALVSMVGQLLRLALALVRFSRISTSKCFQLNRTADVICFRRGDRVLAISTACFQREPALDGH